MFEEFVWFVVQLVQPSDILCIVYQRPSLSLLFSRPKCYAGTKRFRKEKKHLGDPGDERWLPVAGVVCFPCFSYIVARTYIYIYDPVALAPPLPPAMVKGLYSRMYIGYMMYVYIYIYYGIQSIYCVYGVYCICNIYIYIVYRPLPPCGVEGWFVVVYIVYIVQ